MLRTLLHASLVVTLAAGLAGCDNIDESPFAPPPPNYVTTTLEGALARGGAETRIFNVTPTGTTVTVTATITGISRQDEQVPEEPIVVGMALGTWNGAICQLVLVNDSARAGTTIVGSVTGFGSLCVRIYDTGRLETPISYAIDVTHPGPPA
ncbi:MAG: hypothetical protein H0T05_01880 [Acidobacteria bacterium]|nr:hypothetical protein [Acidobacteriota bacterium]MBA3884489.1 hypothetical protein [Acidobacteriota bacterium]